MNIEPGRITDQEDVQLGRPNWTMIFHDLSAAMYQVRPDLMDERDKDLHAILICVHEALEGKTNLHQLSQVCVDHNQQSSIIRPAPRPQLWIPGVSR